MKSELAKQLRDLYGPGVPLPNKAADALDAQAEAIAELVAALDFARCPRCENYPEEEGHKPDCVIGNLIAKHGGTR